MNRYTVFFFAFVCWLAMAWIASPFVEAAIAPWVSHDVEADGCMDVHGWCDVRVFHVDGHTCVDSFHGLQCWEDR